MPSSWAFDAGTMGGAAWTGIGALSSSRPCRTSTTRRSVTLAVRTNEGMVLDARDSVSDHVRQDQLSTALRTTHRSHTVEQSRSTHPLLAVYRRWPRKGAITRYGCGQRGLRGAREFPK
jgi:hypothetical protein